MAKADILIVGRDHAGVGERTWKWDGFVVRQLPLGIDHLLRPRRDRPTEFEVDRANLDRAVGLLEAHSGVVHCESPEAFILQYVRKKRGMKPKRFVVIEGDSFGGVRVIRNWIRRVYGDDPLRGFIRSPSHWWHTSVGSQVPRYRKLGLPLDRVYHVPCSRHFLSHVYPDSERWFSSRRERASRDHLLAPVTDRPSLSFLLKALRGTKVPVLVMGTPPAPGEDISFHVRFRPYAPLPEFLAELGSARFVVVPRLPTRQNPYRGVVTTGLALGMGRALIAPSTFVSKEYLREGYSARFYRAKDAPGLRRWVENLWEDRRAVEKLEQGSRETGDRLDAVARRSMKRMFTSALEAAPS